MPPSTNKFDNGDESRVFGSQEHRGLGDVVRVTPPAIQIGSPVRFSGGGVVVKEKTKEHDLVI